MVVPNTPRTLIEAVKYFADPDNCRTYLVSRRWPMGVCCPQCGDTVVYFDKSRNGWECKTRHPKRKFTLKTGTIFEDSALGLDKWLPCVWMIANAKNGISSHEIARALGVTQKTAWFMLQRIRLAMQGGDTDGKFSGHVEADETFVGGKAKNMHKAKRLRVMGNVKTGKTGKVAVFGLLERGKDGLSSKVRARVIPNVRRNSLQAVIRDHIVTDGTTTLYTDALPSYVRNFRKYGPSHGEAPIVSDYIHEFIDHAETYVNGAVHTNGLENFWALLKRSIRGTYVSVEPFHLFRYLDEQAFRFNHRILNDAQRFGLAIMGIVGRRLMYADLIAAEDAGAI